MKTRSTYLTKAVSQYRAAFDLKITACLNTAARCLCNECSDKGRPIDLPTAKKLLKSTIH